MKHLAEFKKAIGGALVAGGGALATAASDGAVTGTEWLLVLASAATAAGLVYAVPNADPAE